MTSHAYLEQFQPQDDNLTTATRNLAIVAKTVSAQCAALSRDRATVQPLHDVVLVVHDTHPVGDALAEAVADELPEYDVDVAYTFDHAVALATLRRPRMLVTDWHLDHGHTGIELRRLLGVGPLAVLVTAQDVDRESLARIARDVDAQFYVLDPLSQSCTVDRVAEGVRAMLGPTRQ